MDGQAVGVRAPVLIRPLPYWVVSTHREQAKRSTTGTLWGKGRGGGATLATETIPHDGGRIHLGKWRRWLATATKYV